MFRGGFFAVFDINTANNAGITGKLYLSSFIPTLQLYNSVVAEWL
jgi:hypothetical protein